MGMASVYIRMISLGVEERKEAEDPLAGEEERCQQPHPAVQRVHVGLRRARLVAAVECCLQLQDTIAGQKSK